MNALDSPLDAFAFNPVNLGPLLSAVVNNFWAFLAVFTAALISFKHLRSSSSAAAKPLPNLPHQPTTTTTSRFYSNDNDNDDDDDNANEEMEEERVVVLTRGNSKKFFTVFYDEERRENEEDDVDGGDVEDDDEVEVEEGSDDEMMMMKKWEESTVEMDEGVGELGWYGYQDRSVIDGSVVRLWEGERDRSCSPSPRGCRAKLRKSPSFGVTPFLLAL